MHFIEIEFFKKFHNLLFHQIIFKAIHDLGLHLLQNLFPFFQFVFKQMVSYLLIYIFIYWDLFFEFILKQILKIMLRGI